VAALGRAAADSPAGVPVIPADVLSTLTSRAVEPRPGQSGGFIPAAAVDHLVRQAVTAAMAASTAYSPGRPRELPYVPGFPSAAEQTITFPIGAAPQRAQLEPAAASLPATVDIDHEKLLTTINDRIAERPPRRWLDLEDTEHLDQLTAKIYDRLHDRLRREVLVDRERSGRLMDSW
jgi:hypothetical protein